MDRRTFLSVAGATGLATGAPATVVDGQPLAADEEQSGLDEVRTVDTAEIATDASPIVISTTVGQRASASANLQKLSSRAIIDTDRDGVGESTVTLAPVPPAPVEVGTIAPSGIAFGDFSDAIVDLQVGTQTRSGNPTDLVYAWTITDENGEQYSADGTDDAEPDQPDAFVADAGTTTIPGKSGRGRLGDPHRIERVHDGYTVLVSAAVAEGSDADLEDLRVDLVADSEDYYTIAQGSTPANPAREQNGVESSRTIFEDLAGRDVQPEVFLTTDASSVDLTWTLVIFGQDI